jgi:hypothetical protein
MSVSPTASFVNSNFCVVRALIDNSLRGGVTRCVLPF